MDLADLAETFSDIFEDLFGDFAGRSGQGSNQKRQSRGSDLRAEIRIDLKDAYFGATRELVINSLLGVMIVTALELLREVVDQHVNTVVVLGA